MTLNEFKFTAGYMIDRNMELVSMGQTPIAIGIEGEAGIGKSHALRQLASEKNMGYVQINLSELEEVGDLCGLPIKEFKCYEKITKKDGTVKKVTRWYPKEVFDSLPDSPNRKKTSETRTSYAPPAWLPTVENENGYILNLDDYSRSSPLFMQATMELINEGRYIGWELPKNTFIVLSTNPDNGNYSVQGLDPAQKTRFVNFNVEFNINEWALWAEKFGIDSRAINFALFAQEIFTQHSGGSTVNARSYTTFCRAIGGLKDWETPKSLEMIMNISHGCFVGQDSMIGDLFTQFIAQKLDRLVTPSDLLFEDWGKVLPKLKSNVYTDNEFRPEIAAILSLRLLNFIISYFDKDGGKSSVVLKRINDIVDNNDCMLFGEDSIFNIIKRLNSMYPKRMEKLMMNSRIRTKITL